MYRHLMIVSALILASCATNTQTVRFDPNETQTIPREVAVDAVTSFSKSTLDDKDSTCIFTDDGVKHKGASELTPFAQLYFTAKNKAYSFADFHPHIYLFNKKDHTLLCDSLLNLQMMGQKDFENRFKWLGTALMSLGSEYKKETK